MLLEDTAAVTGAAPKSQINDASALLPRDGDDQQWRAALAEEASQVRTCAEVWAVAYRRHALRWRGVSTTIGLVGALLAAVSGGSGLGLPPNVGRLTASIIALAAAAVTAIGSALAAGTRTGEMQAAAKANINLADRARTFATVSAPFAPHQVVASDFDALCKLRDKVSASAPICANRTYHDVPNWTRPVRRDSASRRASGAASVASGTEWRTRGAMFDSRGV